MQVNIIRLIKITLNFNNGSYTIAKLLPSGCPILFHRIDIHR